MSENPSEKKSSGRGVAIVLMVLSIPAAIIACVSVCTATWVINDGIGFVRNNNEFIFSLWVGGVFGVFVFGITIWVAMRMRKGK